MACLRWFMIAGLSAACMVGCGSSTPNAAPDATVTVDKTPPPADAAAVVTTAATAVRDGKLEQAYDLLPASYQTDIDGLVKQFAGQMDSEVWEAGFTTLNNAARLLKVKKDLLLSMIPAQPGKEAQTEQLKANWDDLASGIEQFAASDISNIAKLQSTPVRTMIQQGINPLVKVVASMARVQSQGTAFSFADLEKVKAEVVSSTDNTATVKILSPGKPEAETVDYVKVEGKWVPKSMADGWAKNVESARNGLKGNGGDVIAANKTKILLFIKTLNDALDQMKTAETPEQLQGAAFPVVLQAMAMSAQMAPKTVVTKPKSTAAQVTITVGNELTEDEETKFFAILKGLVGSEDHSITSAKVDGKTIVTVGPVADVDAFAQKLTMAQDVQVDADSRSITVGKVVLE